MKYLKPIINPNTDLLDLKSPISNKIFLIDKEEIITDGDLHYLNEKITKYKSGDEIGNKVIASNLDIGLPKISKEYEDKIIKFKNKDIEVISLSNNNQCIIENNEIKLIYLIDRNGVKFYLQGGDIPLTENVIKDLYLCEKIESFTIIPTWKIELERFRRLLISIEDGNQYILIQEYDENNYKKIKNQIMLFNCDYDGILTLKKLKEIYYSITNKRLY